METPYPATVAPAEGAKSAVSWAAVFAGTAAAAAMTLVLLTLGSGLGFAAASPWPEEGASAATVGVVAGIWLVVTQWLSSGLGGYLAGRLRTRWVGTQPDEVFFRDTAHGFLSWAMASLIVAIVVTSGGSGLLGKAVDSGAKVASAAVQGAASSASSATTLGAYDVDSLFRSTQPTQPGDAADSRAQVTRILTKGLVAGEIPEADRSYLATQIAAQTGLSQEQAQDRLDAMVARVKAADVAARQAVDAARKAAATAAILTALSLLIGAFIASVAAALGGRERDLNP